MTAKTESRSTMRPTNRAPAFAAEEDSGEIISARSRFAEIEHVSVTEAAIELGVSPAHFERVAIKRRWLYGVSTDESGAEYLVARDRIREYGGMCGR